MLLKLCNRGLASAEARGARERGLRLRKRCEWQRVLKGLCGRRGLRERRRHRGLRLRRRREGQRQRTGRGAEAREAGGRVLAGRLVRRRVQEAQVVHHDGAQVLLWAQSAHPSDPDADGPEFRHWGSKARGGERR